MPKTSIAESPASRDMREGSPNWWKWSEDVTDTVTTAPRVNMSANGSEDISRAVVRMTANHRLMAERIRTT